MRSNGQGNAYVAGQTTTGHAYVPKLNADGSTFLYTVTLAGSGKDSAAVVLTDAADNVFLAGQTSSPGFPVTHGVVQERLSGAQNLFVARLDSGGHILFATYLGGSGTETANALQVDGAGNVYVAGATKSLDFPTTPGSFQPKPIVPLWNNGSPGGFVAKLAGDGRSLAYSSYVMSVDNAYLAPQLGVTSLVVAASGEAYLAGSTGAGFPVTASAAQICFGGPTDVFVAHLGPDGALLDASYASSGTYDLVQGLALAGDGSILVQSRSSGNATLAHLRFGASGWSAPACLSPSALNAATFFSPSNEKFHSPSWLSSGELITLTGYGIGPDIGVAYKPDAQGQPPRQLAGVQVFFDGLPAPILYAQSRQVNVLAPFELNGKTSTSILVQYNGVPAGPVTVPVDFALPGIFRRQPGVSSQAAALNQDGTVNGPSNPAARGSIVAVWGTGFGSIAIRHVPPVG